MTFKKVMIRCIFHDWVDVGNREKKWAVLGSPKLPFIVVFSSLIQRLRERFLLRRFFYAPLR